MQVPPVVSSARTLARCRGATVPVATFALALALTGAVRAEACAVNTDCDDGLVCNGVETCNPGTLTCDPGVTLPDGSPCSSGDTCTFVDECQGGVCVAGGGGETDGDGICDADDNCPGDANAGQSDIDGDDIGDPCDDDDRLLNVVVAKLQRNLTPANPKGRIFIKGDFLVTLPEGPLDASSGFLVRIQDTVTPVPLDLQFSWSGGECPANSKGVIKCKSTDKRRQMVLSPIAGSAGQLYRFIIRLSRLTIAGPFAEPVSVTIVNQPATLVTGLDRVGVITDCSQRNLGIVCRE